MAQQIDGIDMVDVDTPATLSAINIDLMSSEMVRWQASVNILKNTDTNSAGTCVDAHMGGDATTVCLTCGQGHACVGHPGCIPLVWPIYHQTLFTYLELLLRCLCYHCGGFCMDRNAKRFADLNKQFPPPTGPGDWVGSLQRLRAVAMGCSKNAKFRLCYKCKYPQPQYTFVKKGNLQINAPFSPQAWDILDENDPVDKQLIRRMRTPFTPVHAREILIAAQRYNGDDLAFLGIVHKGIDAIVPDRLSVLPNNMRSVQSGTMTAHSKARAAHQSTWSIGQVPYMNVNLLTAATSFFASGETQTMKRAATAKKREEQKKKRKDKATALAAAKKRGKARTQARTNPQMEEEEEEEEEGVGGRDEEEEEEEDVAMAGAGGAGEGEGEGQTFTQGLRISPGGIVTGPEKILTKPDPENPDHYSLIITAAEREAMARRRAEEGKLLTIPQFPEVPIATREEMHAWWKADAFHQIQMRELMRAYASWIDGHNSTWKKRGGGGKEDTSLRSMSDKKDGSWRKLSHRRLGFMGRGVIAPETSLHMQSSGTPMVQATTWTVPERVTDFNKEMLTACVRRGAGVLGGATHIVRADGFMQPIPETQEARDAIELEIGWIVRRHMQNGDDVITSRAPVLHTRGFLATRPRITPGDTIRTPAAAQQAQNGDYDGDEENPRIAQSLRERAEFRYLASMAANCISASTNNPQQGLMQNWLSMGWIMCRSWVKRDEIMDLCLASSASNGWDDFKSHPKDRLYLSNSISAINASTVKVPPPAVMMPNLARRKADGSIDTSLPPYSAALWTGKQGFSFALRHDPINYTSAGSAAGGGALPYEMPGEEEAELAQKKRRGKKQENRYRTLLNLRRQRNIEVGLEKLHDFDVARNLVVRNGELVAGSISSKHFAWRGTRSLQHAYIFSHGGTKGVDTLTRMRDVLRTYALRHLHSFKDADFAPSPQAALKMERIRAVTRSTGLRLRDHARDHELDPQLLYDAYEKLAAAHMKSIAAVLMEDLSSRASAVGESMNFLLTMISSGAKGSVGTVMNMSGDMGLQRKQGRPVGIAVKSKRLAPCFGVHRYMTLDAFGMVFSSMLTGLDPGAGVAAHNISTRMDVVTRCNEIADSGALSRRIKHAVGDCITTQTRVIVEGKLVVQQVYGGDGMDPQKLVCVDTGGWLWGSWEDAYPPLSSLPDPIAAELLALRERVQDTTLASFAGEFPYMVRMPWVSEWVWDNRVWGSAAAGLDVTGREEVLRTPLTVEEAKDHASTSIHTLAQHVTKLQGELARWAPKHIVERYSLYHAHAMLRVWWHGVCTGKPHLFGPQVWAAFTQEVEGKVLQALVPAGEAVGVLATQAMGEPMTQMMLNSVHASKALGDPLQEINCLYQRSEPQQGYMEVALTGEVEDERVVTSFISTRLAALATNISIVQDPVQKNPADVTPPEDALLCSYITGMGMSEAELEEYYRTPDPEAGRAFSIIPAPYVIRIQLNARMLKKRRTPASHVARYVARHIQRQRKQFVTTMCTPPISSSPVIRIRPWAQVDAAGNVVLEKQFKYKEVVQDVSLKLVGVGATVAANVYGGTGRISTAAVDAGTGLDRIAEEEEEKEGEDLVASDEAVDEGEGEGGEGQGEGEGEGAEEEKPVVLPTEPYIPAATEFDAKLSGLGTKMDEILLQQEVHDMQKNPLNPQWGEMVREHLSRSLALAGVAGVRDAYITTTDIACRSMSEGGSSVREARKMRVVRCDYSILLGAVRIPGVNPMISWTNNLVDLSHTVGFTAARHQAASMLYQKLCQTGVSIDPRHVQLLIDRQTAQGVWVRVNTAGFSNAGMGALKQLGYERQLLVLSQLGVVGTMDERRGPTGALLGAQRPEVGTGSVTLLAEHIPDNLPKSSTKYSHVVQKGMAREWSVRRQRTEAYHDRKARSENRHRPLPPDIRDVNEPQATDINGMFSTSGWRGQRVGILQDIEMGLGKDGRSVSRQRHAKAPPELEEYDMLPVEPGSGSGMVQTYMPPAVGVTGRAEDSAVQRPSKKSRKGKSVTFSQQLETTFRDSRYFLQPPPVQAELTVEVVGKKRKR